MPENSAEFYLVNLNVIRHLRLMAVLLDKCKLGPHSENRSEGRLYGGTD